MSSDVRSPGGWLTLMNSRITRWLVVGALATGGGAVAFYGQFQGAQASHFCESRLVSATAKTVTYACLNPLPEGISGAVLASDTNGVYINENALPFTRLDVGTSTGATYSGQNIFNSIAVNGAKRWLSTTNTGSVTAQAPAIVAPRNYGTTARKYITATFSAGSGQTVSGEAPAFIRLEVVPCNLDGVGC